MCRSISYYHLTHEFGYFWPNFLKEHRACGSSGVVLPNFAIHQAIIPRQVSGAFHAVKDGVYRPWANVVAMALEFFDQGGSIDGVLHGVVEDMDFYEPQEKLA